MLRTLAAGLISSALLTLAASLASGQDAAAKRPDTSVETTAPSPGAVLDPETRDEIEKLIRKLNADGMRLAREKKTTEAAAKSNSIRTLQILLNGILPADESTRDIAVERAAAAVASAESRLAIQELENEDDLAEAQTRLDLAVLDLHKYTARDYPYEKNSIVGQIQAAQEEVTRAHDKYSATQALFKKNAELIGTAEADRIAVNKTEAILAMANEKLTLHVEYVHPRRLAELKFNVAQRERELRRGRLRAAADSGTFAYDLSLAKHNLEIARLNPSLVVARALDADPDRRRTDGGAAGVLPALFERSLREFREQLDKLRKEVDELRESIR